MAARVKNYYWQVQFNDPRCPGWVDSAFGRPKTRKIARENVKIGQESNGFKYRVIKVENHG